ncbi:hypothetical protein QQP08_004328 [Theobroma cacao]|nr:hypothetical protein QQP08_004328 [Theobroma cacao]
MSFHLHNSSCLPKRYFTSNAWEVTRYLKKMKFQLHNLLLIKTTFVARKQSPICCSSLHFFHGVGEGLKQFWTLNGDELVVVYVNEAIRWNTASQIEI